jgi:DNA-binding MarR family transcriptional regulator
MAVRLTPEQGAVMDFLGRREHRETSFVLGDIARETGLPREDLSRILGSLSRRRLAERVSTRPVRYRLTGQGLTVQGYRDSVRRVTGP